MVVAKLMPWLRLPLAQAQPAEDEEPVVFRLAAVAQHNGAGEWYKP